MLGTEQIMEAKAEFGAVAEPGEKAERDQDRNGDGEELLDMNVILTFDLPP